jgi:hypothetical protein
LNGDGKTDIILYNADLPLLRWRSVPNFTSVRLGRYTGHASADLTSITRTPGWPISGLVPERDLQLSISVLEPGLCDVVPEDVNGEGKGDIVLYNSAAGTEYTGLSNDDGTFAYTYS